MREVDIENAFVDFAKTRGCLALKLVLLNLRGFPDRTVLCPGGRVIFFEFKKPGGKLSKNQEKWISTLSKLGFECHVSDDTRDACNRLDDFIAAE